MRGFAVMLVLALVLPAGPVRAASADDRYTIMTPEPHEPWLAPKYKSPRGTREQAVPPPKPRASPPQRAGIPPPLYVPETGRLLPNLPAISPANPARRETYQDRAVRCAHQAGVYGDAAGDRSAYIGSCINQ